MMTDASAKGLRLAVGSPAKMMDASGSPQDASSQALTRQEILQLVGPIIPEHARRRLPQEATVEFDHSSPSGAFKVTILRNGSEIAVSIVPDPGAGETGGAGDAGDAGETGETGETGEASGTGATRAAGTAAVAPAVRPGSSTPRAPPRMRRAIR